MSAKSHVGAGVFPGESVYYLPPNEELLRVLSTKLLTATYCTIRISLHLQPYDYCTKYQEEVEDSDTIDEEQKLFENEPVARATLDNVNRRLGFLDQPLEFDDLLLMYDMCR